jgi:hypothetical protein
LPKKWPRKLPRNFHQNRLFQGGFFHCGLAALLWANGDAGYNLSNIDYNYWTAGDGSVNNPVTASLPLIDTDSFAKNTQIFPAAGWREYTSNYQGTNGYYWSDTPGSNTNGYRFEINGSYVYPIYATSYAFGFSIRCVRI